MRRRVQFTLTPELLVHALSLLGMPSDTEIIGFREQDFPSRLLVGVQSDDFPPVVEGGLYPAVVPTVKVTEHECGHRTYEWDWNLVAAGLEQAAQREEQ
jgi:hypothetical protein